MPKLKAKLTSAPPDALKDFYVKEGDSWIVDIEPIEGWDLQDVEGMRTTLSDQKERHRKAREEADQWKDLGLTPQEAKALREKVAELEKSGDPAKVQSAVASAVKQAEARAQADITKLQEREKFLLDQTRAALRDSAVDIALGKYAKDENAAKLLRPHVLSGLEMQEADGKIGVIVRDASGNPRISTKKGAGTAPMTVEEYVEEMSKSKEYAMVFKGSGAAGGGSNGAGGGGTGVHQEVDPSLTPAQKLRAARAQQAAGV